MPLVKAVIAGAVGALAIPWAIRGGTGPLVTLLHYGLVEIRTESVHVAWSWPVFCIVTLFAWAMLKWAD
jgi:hypothetical protein